MTLEELKAMAENLRYKDDDVFEPLPEEVVPTELKSRYEGGGGHSSEGGGGGFSGGGGHGGSSGVRGNDGVDTSEPIEELPELQEIQAVEEEVWPDGDVPGEDSYEYIYWINRILGSDYLTEAQQSMYNNTTPIPSDWEITSVFWSDSDSTRNTENGQPDHMGIDIAPPTSGDPGVDVSANSVWNGTIEETGWTGDRGNYVVLKLDKKNKEGKDVYILFQHLRSLNVAADDKVTAGTPLGIIGWSGEEAKDYHLHVEVWIGKTALTGDNRSRKSGIIVDPLGEEASEIMNPFLDYGFRQYYFPGR